MRKLKRRRPLPPIPKLPHASGSRRLTAFVLDWYLTTLLTELCISAISLIYTGESYWTESLGWVFPDSIDFSAFLLYLLLAVVIAVVYHLVLPLVAARFGKAATPGQLLLHLQVTDAQLKTPSAKKILLRNGVGFLLIQISITSVYQPLRTVLELALPGTPLPVLLFGASLIVTFVSLYRYFTRKQTLQDAISSTYLLHNPENYTPQDTSIDKHVSSTPDRYTS